MSWKSLITAGLFCLLASPVFADPTLDVLKAGALSGGTQANGNLDDNGNWVWKVTVTPDLTKMPQLPTPDTTGTPVAVELGFISSRDVKGAARLNQATNFDTLNPGTAVFTTWQTAGNLLLDANSNNKPTGLQLNGPSIGTTAGASYTPNSSVSGSDNQVFAALGSVVFTTQTAKDVITITAKGPVAVTGNTSTITTTGAAAYGNKPRISQISGGTSGGPYTTANYDLATAVYTRTVIDGDANMDGTRGSGDLNLVLTNFGHGTGGPAGPTCVQPNTLACVWYHGEFTGDGLVSSGDLNLVLTLFGATGGVGLGGVDGGGLSVGTVPEPASIALLGLALLGGLGITRRKR